MRAGFEGLADAAPATEDVAVMRARLDGFAALFAPQLDQAIEADRRQARLAEEGLARQRALMRTVAVATALGAAALLLAFHLLLVRPLLRGLARVAQAAEAVGAGEFGRIPVDRRDELGLVFARINRMAARLGRGWRALERDRARLEATVAERTAALSSANARLEATDAERRRLFADVGHELRTPLTVILAETELAARPGSADADLRAGLAVIGARARRLNRRIDDLLRVARSESGELELGAAPFDLAAAARDAMEDVAPLARRAKVAVVAQVAPAPAAFGDRDWSRQVIAGILDNAIRHSPAGAAIEVAVAPAGAKIAVTVTDEGEGVLAADLDRIFRRHARGPGRGLGFGVGLALARWVMERQGGTIALRSPAGVAGARGPGTRVELVFPGAPA
jgi:signal transduction histidine kinase